MCSIQATFAQPIEHVNAAFTDIVSPYGDGAYGMGPYGAGLVSTANPAQLLNATFASPVDHINATLGGVTIPTPYTTIDSSATVKDQNGSLISNLSAYTLAVTYQDGTTASPSVTNAGSGIYTATYNTKGPGVLSELWSFTDASGNIAQEQRTLDIAY